MFYFHADGRLYQRHYCENAENWPTPVEQGIHGVSATARSIFKNKNKIEQNYVKLTSAFDELLQSKSNGTICNVHNELFKKLSQIFSTEFSLVSRLSSQLISTTFWPDTIAFVYFRLITKNHERSGALGGGFPNIEWHMPAGVKTCKPGSKKPGFAKMTNACESRLVIPPN